MKLRPYQEDFIKSIKQATAENHRRICCVAPCGFGKTAIMDDICNSSKVGKPLVVVHRLDLMQQLQKQLNADCCMIQSIKNINLNNYKMILIDECHHSSASSYNRLFDNPNTFIYGFTATPIRLDGKGLKSRFNCLVEGKSTSWLIDNGYLSNYDYFSPNINLANAFFTMKGEGIGGEYTNTQIENEFDKQAIYGDILKYIDFNKKTLIYCNSIKTSQRIAETIGKDKVNHIDGSFNQDERQRIFNEFKNGTRPIITSVDLISEGLDFPSCDCVMLLRPTNSLNLYIQQSMRCLRIDPQNPNKRALIYDFVGNVFKFNTPTAERIWSLDGKKIKSNINKTDDKELLCRQCKNCLRIFSGTAPLCPFCGFNNGKTRSQLQEEKQTELIQIKKLEKKKRHQAQSYEDLVKLGFDRGYKNPYGWAYFVFNARNKKN